MRLYFFPALLPLATFLPITLALVGALGGALHLLRKRPYMGIAFFIACVCIAAGVYGFDRLSKDRRLLELPQSQTVENLPAIDTHASWSQLLPRVPLSNLALSSEHELILFGTKQKTLDALSLRDGRMVFSLVFAEPVLTEPLIVGDRVFVGEGLHDANRARIVAIELPQGRALWQQTFLSHVESAPRMAKDHKSLVGCAGEAGVYSLAPSDGRILWQRSIGHCDMTPWLEEDEVFVLARHSDKTSRLHVLDIKSGETKWTLDLPGDPWGSVRRDPLSRYLLFTTGLGQLSFEPLKKEMTWVHAVDTNRRSILWTKTMPSMPLPGGIIYRHGQTSGIIQTSKSGDIHALDALTGSVVWRRKLSSSILASPRQILSTSNFVALAIDGTLYEIDGTNGKILSQRKLGVLSTSAAVSGASMAYFASRESLTVLSLSEGRLKK